MPKRLRTRDFLAQHPLFTVGGFAAALGRKPDDPAVLRRIGRNRDKGRLRRVARSVYAVVPRAKRGAKHDPYVVATVVREDGIVSGRAALELLGVADDPGGPITVLAVGHQRGSQMSAVRAQLRAASRGATLPHAAESVAT